MKWKQILLLVAIPIVAVAPLPFVLTGCNKTKSESDWMVQLYQDRMSKKEPPITCTEAQWAQLWQDSLNKNINKTKEIQYAIEYSLFSFVFEPSYQLIDGVTLPEGVTIYDWIINQNSGVDVNFKTSYYDCEYQSPNSFKVSYTGYMQLGISKKVILPQSELVPGDLIQLAYSFQYATASFPQDPAKWWQISFNPNTTDGNQAIGMNQIYHDGHQYDYMMYVTNFTTSTDYPNYFNAVK
ncbi:MAG: hypothetical protein LBM72_02680 [Mycoplasmataceae bacterium]|jgi:hypothetical protein|nr:hypothetical protein [Mycoplasmataceae bacterium]